MASKQNHVKRQFLYIDRFYHEGPVVINAMLNLTVGVFEHLEIITPTDVDKRLACTHCIIIVSVLKNTKNLW